MKAKNESFFDIFWEIVLNKKVDMPTKKFVLKVDNKGYEITDILLTLYIDKEVFKKPKITGDASFLLPE